MTERHYYLHATKADEQFRVYVAPADLLAEIRRCFAAGFVKVTAELEARPK